MAPPFWVDQTALCPPNCHSHHRCPMVLSSHTHFSRWGDSWHLNKGGANELCLTSSVPNHRAAVIYCCCPPFQLLGCSQHLSYTALCRNTATVMWAFCKKLLTENVCLRVVRIILIIYSFKMQLMRWRIYLYFGNNHRLQFWICSLHNVWVTVWYFALI